MFACATSFAAFAALAATLLPFRQALISVLCSWLVNQAIGFGVLDYPHTASTLAILGRLAFINAVWMIGLMAVYEIAYRTIVARAAGVPAARKSAA